MKISEILKNKSTISFEVFPPKNKEGDISSIYSTIEGLAKLSPDFISVTYGAGGSTKGKTVEIASVIKHEYGIESVAHLSCISSTKEDIKYECERLKEAGIDNILALRGDYPADAINFDPENLEFHYASELNEFIGEHFKGQFCLSGACYPETHQEADGFKKDLEALKKESKKNEATITQYLASVLIYSIYEENYKKNNGKKPIKLCIPVNLKKYFQSKTISNFFSYITLEAQIQKDNLTTFDKILKFVKEDFKKRLTQEEIIKTMSANVKLGNNPFVRVIPLSLKKILVRLSYIEIRKYTTITFSNIGRIGIIGKYQKYIEDFFMLIAPEPVEKIKCSACTYENDIVFTFTSILQDNSIEKRFFEFLTQNGIKVRIESNGVLDAISTKN